MSDPLRTDHKHDLTAPTTDAGAERDAKIESLLLSGLDHYFASNYAQAIDVWTRALFLDRQHARARAYIDRARTALAEQQRESEELLHNGVAAFERGEIDAARQLLNAAVQRGGAHDVALAFLTRIDRLNAAAPATAAPSAVPARLPFQPTGSPAVRSAWPWARAFLVLGMLATIGLAIARRDEVRAMIPFTGAGAESDITPVRPVQEPVIVPRSSDMAIDRARALFASGRLYDALRAVDLVRSTDPRRADADRLKAAIQRELLAYQTSPGGAELTTRTERAKP
jgi:tetratricopeptide (TPR) repeat protein